MMMISALKYPNKYLEEHIHRKKNKEVSRSEVERGKSTKSYLLCYAHASFYAGYCSTAAKLKSKIFTKSVRKTLKTRVPPSTLSQGK